MFHVFAVRCQVVHDSIVKATVRTQVCPCEVVSMSWGTYMQLEGCETIEIIREDVEVCSVLAQPPGSIISI